MLSEASQLSGQSLCDSTSRGVWSLQTLGDGSGRAGRGPAGLQGPAGHRPPGEGVRKQLGSTASGASRGPEDPRPEGGQDPLMLSERAVGPGPRGARAEAGGGPSGAWAKEHAAPALAAPALPVEMQGAGVPNSMVLTLASRSERAGATRQLRAELSLDAHPVRSPGPFPDAVEPWLLPRCLKLAQRALRPASRGLVQGRALILAPCGLACVPAATKRTITSVLLKQPVSASWSCWDPTSCQGWFLLRLQGTLSLVPGSLSWLYFSCHGSLPEARQLQLQG